MYDVFYHPEKVGASIEVLQAAGNEKVAQIEAIYEISGEKHCAKFLVRLKVVCSRVNFIVHMHSSIYLFFKQKSEKPY